MYLKNEVINKIIYIGKIHDKKWSELNGMEDKILIVDDQEILEDTFDFLWEWIGTFIYEEICKEEVILQYPTKERILELIKPGVFNIINGEEYFGEMINNDLMSQIIKESINISLLHGLKDGNKRTAWFFFMFAVKLIYFLEGKSIDNRAETLREFPIIIEMNELILKVSEEGNENIDMFEISNNICDKFRKELSIISLTYKEEK